MNAPCPTYKGLFVTSYTFSCLARGPGLPSTGGQSTAGPSWSGALRVVICAARGFGADATDFPGPEVGSICGYPASSCGVAWVDWLEWHPGNCKALAFSVDSALVICTGVVVWVRSIWVGTGRRHHR